MYKIKLNPTVPSTSPPTSSSSRILSESCNPLVKALAEYEQQFLLHFKKGKALQDGAQMRLRACANSIQEQETQELAVRAAISNLESFQASTSKRFHSFWKSFQQQSAKQEALLQNFDSDIAKVSEVDSSRLSVH